MSNPFVHLELNTPDVDKAKAFYGELFGWQYMDMPMGPDATYTTFKPSEGPGGGIMNMPEAPNGWRAYVGVREINEATEKARSLGATIQMGPHEIPHVGWFTLLLDPTGCAIAMFQPM